MKRLNSLPTGAIEARDDTEKKKPVISCLSKELRISVF